MNGQLNGLKREWNIFGQLTSVETFKDGFRVFNKKNIIKEAKNMEIFYRLGIAGK